MYHKIPNFPAAKQLCMSEQFGLMLLIANKYILYEYSYIWKLYTKYILKSIDNYDDIHTITSHFIFTRGTIEITVTNSRLIYSGFTTTPRFITYIETVNISITPLALKNTSFAIKARSSTRCTIYVTKTWILSKFCWCPIWSITNIRIVNSEKTTEILNCKSNKYLLGW